MFPTRQTRLPAPCSHRHAAYDGNRCGQQRVVESPQIGDIQLSASLADTLVRRKHGLFDDVLLAGVQKWRLAADCQIAVDDRATGLDCFWTGGGDLTAT